MNKAFITELLRHLRYGSFSKVWPRFSMALIGIGGARFTSYLSYWSIDWGSRKKDQAILCFYRESFIKDLEESSAFHEQGVAITYNEYDHQEYSQLFGEFVPYMSIVDLLFNEGPESLSVIQKGYIQND